MKKISLSSERTYIYHLLRASRVPRISQKVKMTFLRRPIGAMKSLYIVQCFQSLIGMRGARIHRTIQLSGTGWGCGVVVRAVRERERDRGINSKNSSVASLIGSELFPSER